MLNTQKVKEIKNKMTSLAEWFSLFVFDYPSLQYVIIFLGAAFGGELAFFALSLLAAQGLFPLHVLISLGFLGTVSSDILWFLCGKAAFFKKIISYRYAHSTVSVLAEAIDRISRGNRLIALIFTKFLVGTRIVLIMYLSKNNLELRRFIAYDSVAAIIWLLVVIPIGFVSGLGFTYLAEIFNNLYVELGLLLLFLFIVSIIQIWFEKIFIKKI